MGIELTNEQVYALYDIENWWNKSDDQVYELSSLAGGGKMEPYDKYIPTPNGYKLFGNLKVGDMIFGKNGNSIKILNIFEKGIQDVYKVTFEDGRTCECGKDHLWAIKTKDDTLMTLSTEYMYNQMNTFKTLMNSKGFIVVDEAIENMKSFYSIPLCKPVEYEKKNFSIAPYSHGNIVKDSISPEYFYGDIEQRWNLIQGIFDHRGIIVNGDIKYITFNRNLLKDILTLLYSLGVKTIVKKSDMKRTSLCYILTIKAPKETKIKFFANDIVNIRKLKAFNENPDEKYDRMGIIEIEKLKTKKQMRCLYVDDPLHLYLTNDYLVTHNTTLVRYAIDNLGLDYNEVAFICFQGKGAMQLARKGLPAQTIHSFIYDFEKIADRDENGKLILNKNGKPKMKTVFTLRKRLPKQVKLIVIDEASMVSESMAHDILSFNVPIIALGDLNQLPPVFGNSYFLKNPNFQLTKVMRQNEDDPIVWLSQRVLNDQPLQYGVYGKSSVIRRSDLNDYLLKNTDIVLTYTNRLRGKINDLYRHELLDFKRTDIPNEGEKIICRKNNWNRSINDSVYLTNGMSGFVDYVDMESFNGKTIKMDFRPDFLNKKFKNLIVDYNHLFTSPTETAKMDSSFDYTKEKFEFAYAITVMSAQGSEYKNVIYLDEHISYDKSFYKKLQYTAITRAMESITIVI